MRTAGRRGQAHPAGGNDLLVARTGRAGGPGAGRSGGPCRWREVEKEIVAAAAALRPRSRLTSSGPAGALLDPSPTSAFYPSPGVISDLSAAFPPAELRAGECAPPRVRPYSPGVEAGESRPCIEMGLAGGRERAGDINRSFASCFSFPATLLGPFLPIPNNSWRGQRQLRRSAARRKCGAHGVTQSENSPSQRPSTAARLPSPRLPVWGRGCARPLSVVLIPLSKPSAGRSFSPRFRSS